MKRYSIADIRRINKEKGQFWFSPDTMKFFASRVLSNVYNGPNGVFFVTSEKRGFDQAVSGRGYTVRKFDPETGRIKTHGYFNQYRHAEVAKVAAKRAACDYGY